METEEEIINKILQELDEMFDGKATANYKNHVIQNWSKEPYIRGAYTFPSDDAGRDYIDTLKRPIDNKIYFAGEAMTNGDSATVHGAAESAYEVLEGLLQG